MIHLNCRSRTGKDGNGWERYLVKLAEKLNCYQLPEQREVLLKLFDNKIIRGQFFLTGGTALSVFYLHHRKSNDLDLFSIAPPPFSDIDYWGKLTWHDNFTKLKKETFILSADILGVKIDLVHDPLSLNDQKILYDTGNKMITVDTLDNITSNKLCTLVNRQEPKDFIDFYFLSKRDFFDLKFVYENAQKKEGMFDDPPMVAYQIENNLNALKQNPFGFPEMLIDFERDELFRYFENFCEKVYHHKL